MKSPINTPLMQQVENSRADMVADKRNGVKEGSPADMKQDAALAEAMQKRQYSRQSITELPMTPGKQATHRHIPSR